MDDEVTLMPCPFCGFQAGSMSFTRDPVGIAVFCRNCDSTGRREEDQRSAAEAWNRRYSGPQRSAAPSAGAEDEIVERIERAAVLHEGQVWQLPRPARHHHILHAMVAVLKPSGGIANVQGFVTNTGRFVEREEACTIARRAGQIPAVPPRCLAHWEIISAKQLRERRRRRA